MDLQTISDVLKVVGGVVGSGLAIAAVVGRYTFRKKLTRLGVSVVVGIIIALGFTMSSLIINSLISRRDDKKRDEQVANTIHQVDRGLYPLENLSVSYDLVIISGNRQLDDYSRALGSKLQPLVDYDRESEAATPKKIARPPDLKGIVGSGGGSDGVDYSIDPRSPLGPPAPIKEFLSEPPIWVTFSKLTFTDAQLEDGAGDPDHEADFTPAEASTRTTISYAVSTSGVVTVGTSSAGKLDRDQTGPSLVSLLDFDGGQILIHAGESDSSECNGNVDPANIKIDTVLITLSSGQALYLTSSMLHRIVPRVGCPIYVYDLPNSDDQMLATFK